MMTLVYYYCFVPVTTDPRIRHKVDGRVFDFWQVIEYLKGWGCRARIREKDHPSPREQEKETADQRIDSVHAADGVQVTGLADIDEWLTMCSDS